MKRYDGKIIKDVTMLTALNVAINACNSRELERTSELNVSENVSYGLHEDSRWITISHHIQQPVVQQNN